MSKLKLSPGPLLERLEWWDDSSSESMRAKRANVTDRAAEFLFYPVEVDAAVTLADLFALISANTVLLNVFRQEFVVELCEEAAKGFAPNTKKFDRRLEYLELLQKWRLHSHSKTFESVAEFELVGRGMGQSEDGDDSESLIGPKGELVTYSVSMSSVRKLLQLPIRLSSRVEFIEADHDSCRQERPVKDAVAYTFSRITLGQLIHTVLDDLSWHGTPEDTELVVSRLKEQLADNKKNPGQGILHEDVMESLGFAPRHALFDKVFSKWSEVTAANLDSGLHNLEDDDSAQIGLTELFGDQVVLINDFSELNSRELRLKIREIRSSIEVGRLEGKLNGPLAEQKEAHFGASAKHDDNL